MCQHPRAYDPIKKLAWFTAITIIIPYPYQITRPDPLSPNSRNKSAPMLTSPPRHFRTVGIPRAAGPPRRSPKSGPIPNTEMHTAHPARLRCKQSEAAAVGRPSVSRNAPACDPRRAVRIIIHLKLVGGLGRQKSELGRNPRGTRRTAEKAAQLAQTEPVHGCGQSVEGSSGHGAHALQSACSTTNQQKSAYFAAKINQQSAIPLLLLPLPAPTASHRATLRDVMTCCRHANLIGQVHIAVLAWRRQSWRFSPCENNR